MTALKLYLEKSAIIGQGIINWNVQDTHMCKVKIAMIV